MDWNPLQKAIIGSQQVPYIYEDRLSKSQVVEALMKMRDLGPDKRKEMGLAGQKHINENYDFDTMAKEWHNFILDVHKKCGSWETRKNYKNWELKEI